MIQYFEPVMLTAIACGIVVGVLIGYAIMTEHPEE